MTPLRVVVRVEDEGACGAIWVTARWRHVANDCFQSVVDAESGLCGCMHDFIVEKPDELSDFRRHLLWVGAGKVDLVDDRDDGQVLLEAK